MKTLKIKLGINDGSRRRRDNDRSIIRNVWLPLSDEGEIIFQPSAQNESSPGHLMTHDSFVIEYVSSSQD